jgi:hypothetical protein
VKASGTPSSSRATAAQLLEASLRERNGSAEAAPSSKQTFDHDDRVAAKLGDDVAPPADKPKQPPAPAKTPPPPSEEKDTR